MKIFPPKKLHGAPLTSLGFFFFDSHPLNVNEYAQPVWNLADRHRNTESSLTWQLTTTGPELRRLECVQGDEALACEPVREVIELQIRNLFAALDLLSLSRLGPPQTRYVQHRSCLFSLMTNVTQRESGPDPPLNLKSPWKTSLHHKTDPVYLNTSGSSRARLEKRQVVEQTLAWMQL